MIEPADLASYHAILKKRRPRVTISHAVRQLILDELRRHGIVPVEDREPDEPA